MIYLGRKFILKNMENRKTTIIAGVIALAIIIGILFYASKVSGGPGKLDAFAQCLSDKGAKFYGAFWCPHCQNQKTIFGSSKKYLPYIECSTPDGRNQIDECNKAGITGYPTWIFEDMSTSTGEQSLETLSQKTGCALPE